MATFLKSVFGPPITEFKPSKDLEILEMSYVFMTKLGFDFRDGELDLDILELAEPMYSFKGWIFIFQDRSLVIKRFVDYAKSKVDTIKIFEYSNPDDFNLEQAEEFMNLNRV